MNLLQRLKAAYKVARHGVPVRTRMYHGARPTRASSGLIATTTSADAELASSLTNLRGRSRALMRDSPYARRARRLWVNNVIGGGMGLQAQVRNSRKEMHEKANDGIEGAFEYWSRGKFCHTGGALHFGDFERLAMGEVFEAGEVFIRQHMRSFGGSKIPYALELIESERVPHEFLTSFDRARGAEMRLGIEVDEFYRPITYWVRDRFPSEFPFPADGRNEVRPIPADEIIHLRIIERWPQTRGVPALHCVLVTLNNMEGYTEAELVAARGAANYLGWLEQSDLDDPDVEEQEDGTYETELSPGIIGRGPPGSEMKFNNPNRPNAALDPFMRYLLRQCAAGLDVSYASLSRDYAQTNYSSSRLDLLDDRDLWRVLQLWWMRSFRCEVHPTWLRQAVLANAVEGVPFNEYGLNPEKFEAASYKARGWSWIDPTKEVEAFEKAVKAGFTTRTKVIAQTANGDDIEDIDRERAQELKDAKALGLEYTTDPGADEKKAQTPAKPAADGDAEAGDETDSQEDRHMRVVK